MRRFPLRLWSHQAGWQFSLIGNQQERCPSMSDHLSGDGLPGYRVEIRHESSSGTSDHHHQCPVTTRDDGEQLSRIAVTAVIGP